MGTLWEDLSLKSGQNLGPTMGQNQDSKWLILSPVTPSFYIIPKNPTYTI